MKKLLFIFLFFVLQSWKSDAQCTCNYSYTGTTDTLTFTNLSVVSNAHYYWNFGDGQTDYAINPVHVFPESGKYHVTLFGKDTVSNCHTYYESWIDVTKPTTNSCNAAFGDSINYSGGYIIPYDSSANCGMYHSLYDVAGAMNFSSGNWIGVSSWGNSLYLGRVNYSTHDSINGYIVKRQYYKTIPYNYSSSVNYQSCSANFEYYINYQATGAMVYLKSMNPSATIYRFVLTGMGNPINLLASSTSYFYNYVSYENYFPWLITSYTHDASGCEDTLTQQILIRNPYYVEPPTCAMPTSPQNQSAVFGSTTLFYIATTSPSVTKQWQQDAGLGYANLTNAGPYNGVTTDSLTIANVQLTRNNYHYRCVLSNNVSGCHNTSTDAVLTVLPEGVSEIIGETTINISPNPFTSQTTISFSTEQKNTTIKIMDVIGKEIKTVNFTGKQYIIEKGTMQSGVYFVQITDTNKNMVNRKVVVE